MPAPIVTRPSASVVDDPKSGKSSGPSIDWTQYARWAVLAGVVLGLSALAYSLFISWSTSSRTTKARSLWDEEYSALKKKETEEEQIDALEHLCENAKIKGTAVHATALMHLGRKFFEMGQSPRKQPESRAAALDRAAKIYEMVATVEPFKSNPSFGPLALSNLALTYEQQQMSNNDSTEFYDKAIKTLQAGIYRDESKEAEPIGSMKTHFLFDKMNAQLGRLYWLRAQFKEQGATRNALMNLPIALWPYYVEKYKATSDKADREMALFYLKRADVGIPGTEKERLGGQKAPWREEAAYLKALLEPPGKMLPTGIPPAMKPEPVKDDGGFWGGLRSRTESKKEVEKADAKPAETKPVEKPAEKTGDTKPDTTKPGANKPVDTKPTDKKPDEKKPGNANAQKIPASYISDASAAPQQSHLTYSQIQAMLKQGKSALCECPRCAPTDKAIGAKLVE